MEGGRERERERERGRERERESLIELFLRISNTLFAGQGRESGVSPSGGGVGYKSCDAFVQPAFFVAGNCARNGVANVVAFRNLFSSILSIKI